ncbi:uncharacterized protein LY89DRAFT_663858 [Mollisia scopiformis]|uniref:Uncharacterized protein n=1 Tax=Mollisia scopiformis TaxID=149040 RepID=A0A194XUP0_MOLSC|nr:uncharacterized protein LY89DRAFT_663858 [Mollisia scopiformis]KUJ23422.1 hypothetical protein LY89DRAFT_663858 [Mollisia scopiformis]
MGEARDGDQNCFPGASSFYSARLLWKVLSQTKAIVSVLKAEKNGVKRKISVRKTRTREWVEKGGYTDPEKRRRNVKTSCYLCKFVSIPSFFHLVFSNEKRLRPLNASNSTLDLPYFSPANYPPYQESITYLPITRSQPPALPRRSTSLPYYKILKQLKRLQIVTGPHPPLLDFRLRDMEEGLIWRSVAENKARDEIWKLALQISHEENCVRELLLAIGSSRGRERHCLHALRELRALLAQGRRVWEISFLSIYLLAYLNTLLGDRRAVRCWMRTAYRVLKGALRVFGADEEGMRLPEMMIDVVGAFRRLELR